MRKIKQGDEVIVLTGKDKGKRGSVLRVLEDDRVVVENINMVKRHTKANPQRGETGEGDRVGFKILEDGRKVRIFKSTGEVVDI